MGSGKSTVARALARRLDTQIVDLDGRSSNKKNAQQSRLEEDGEPAFREIETRVLRDVLKIMRRELSHSGAVPGLCPEIAI